MMNANEISIGGSSTLVSRNSERLDAVYAKVMWRIVPFLFLTFVMAWIDRVNVGFTKLQMNESLAFSETVYGLGAGIFFIGYLLFEIPSNLALERFGARKTISRIAVGWGLCSIGLAFVTTPTQFYVLRFILGACEAGLWPGIVLYVTYWFPTSRRSKAFALIGCGSSMSGIIGGPLAGFLMVRMDGVQNWEGWQWVFFLEGVPSVLLGIAAIWALTDRPHQAHWLSAEERELLAADLAKDASASGKREHSFFQSLKNKTVWLYIAIYFCIIMGQSTLIFWAPSMLKEVGITSPATIGYIISGVFLVGIIAVIVNGIHSDRAKEINKHCGLAVLVASLGCALLGYFLMLGSQWVILAMCIALPGILCSIPVFWQLPNRVLVGTAAAAGIAMINSIGNLSGFFAPVVLGTVKDATGQIYHVVWAVAVILAIGGTLTLLAKRPSRENA
ncbi:MFS transporter [Herbaspirillum sp. GCM10030257]|uniref:MFS transporter n=1 Tax=Herbaspirillum sp. GCM10030257 TaxID=3273393 RepID=UPI00361A3793